MYARVHDTFIYELEIINKCISDLDLLIVHISVVRCKIRLVYITDVLITITLLHILRKC